MHVTQLGIEIGPVLLSSFGLIVIGAVVVGTVVTWQRVRSRDLNPAMVFDLYSCMLVLGVAIGRLVYIWSPPPSISQFYSHEWYLSHPLDLLSGPLAIWNGGLDNAGVLIGAGVGALLGLRSVKGALAQWVDAVAPGVLAALVILPWANITTGNLLGPPTNLPWGIAAPSSSNSIAPVYYHPTPAYVSLWALVTLIAIRWLSHKQAKRIRPGDLALMAGLIYMPGLFMADMLRVDVNRFVLGLTLSQIVALMSVLGIGIVALRGRRRSRVGTGEGANEFTQN